MRGWAGGSVISYSLEQSTPEIGVRLALGANRGDILAWVILPGMRLAAVGVAAGTAAAAAAVRLHANMLLACLGQRSRRP